jgi:Protein of unknown function (DUF2612)
VQDWIKTVVSQYGNSATLLQLIESFNENLDPAQNFNDFYQYIWDIDTAVGIGLDIWGRIVGVSRVLTFAAPPTYLGFHDGLTDYAPLGQAPFNAGIAVTQNFSLSDAAFRALILVKAAANIAATSTQALNQLLTSLFAGRGRCYVNDLGNMKMRYTFEFYLQPYELAILSSSGALPRPAGVGISILQAPHGSTFGFKEAGDAETFGHGTFISPGEFYAVAI